MASVLTNNGALSALQTLRSVTTERGQVQDRISSGLRVEAAADDAAYWSVSTTMRSDKMALSAIADTLGLGAAKVDTAAVGLDAVIGILGQFEAKLVTAKEGSVDLGKIQAELAQYQQAVVDIARSSSFNGQNWLNTDIADMYDDELTETLIRSSFTRGDKGRVTVETMGFSLSKTSLFNAAGGGLLQPDIRDVGKIGGMRSFTPWEPIYTQDTTVHSAPDGTQGWMVPSRQTGSAGSFSWSFPDGSPLDFNSPGAEIRFTLILDKEASNPNNGLGSLGQLQELPGPYDPGSSVPVIITKADVDAYAPSWGGVVSTNTDFADLLNHLLGSQGATVSGNYENTLPSGIRVHNPVMMSIITQEDHLDGSYVGISNLTSSGVSTGGLFETEKYGTRGSGMALPFEPFTLFQVGNDDDGVEVSFRFSLNSAAPIAYSFNRTTVNAVLGRNDGRVETAEEMVTLYKSLLSTDWPSLIIEVGTDGKVILKSDPAVDREWGSRTRIGFDTVRVDIEPLPTLSFLDIDVEKNPDQIDTYLAYIDTARERIIDGAASLGALRARIEQQTDMVQRRIETTGKGIGRLVDADMNRESTRLKALQTREKLGTQALQIANARPEMLLQLFR
ncbi:MAG: flagellin [Rhizobium sp.]|nr:flagellin [Rhizobium sp.]